MVRTKYNNLYHYKNAHKKGMIELRLRNEIKHILTPDIESFHKYYFDSLYVKIDEYEKELEIYKNKTGTDCLRYVTGLTGCGKSSLLKSVFHHFENVPIIKNNTLIIPFSCDSQFGDVQKELSNRIANLLFSCCVILIDNYGIKKYNEDIHDFYKYIKKRRPQFSVNQNNWKNCTEEEIITQIYNNSVLELSLLALKYSLSQESCKVNNIVFIMDDIESVGNNKELIPVLMGNKIMTCLQNRSYEEKDKWSCNVIIACRHYVFRLLRSRNYDMDQIAACEVNAQTLESYFGDGDDLDVNQTPNLKEIIEKRISTILNNCSDDDRRKELIIVQDLLDMAFDLVGELILDINLFNYRLAFDTLKKLIFNRRWLQKQDTTYDGVFRIKWKWPEDFNTNRPAFIRALGMGERDCYSSNHSIFPNLLSNDSSGKSDFIKLFTLKYFIRNYSDRVYDWSRSINLEKVYQEIDVIFDKYSEKNKYNEMKEGFRESTMYLILNRLLLRSKFQIQQDSSDLIEENIINVKDVYLSHTAIQLWDILGTSSVLFEMFVDDIWIENPVRNYYDTNRKFNKFSYDNYRESLSYLKYLIIKESELRLYIANREFIDKYRVLFGKTLITRQLYNGLKASYNAYFSESQEVEFIRTLAAIDASLDLCQNIFS